MVLRGVVLNGMVLMGVVFRGCSPWAVWSLGVWSPPVATAVVGTHPTGMHSCYEMKIVIWYVVNNFFKYQSNYWILRKHYFLEVHSSV